MHLEEHCLDVEHVVRVRVVQSFVVCPALPPTVQLTDVVLRERKIRDAAWLSGGHIGNQEQFFYIYIAFEVLSDIVDSSFDPIRWVILV